MALHCCQKGLWNELTLTRIQLPGFEISKNQTLVVVQITQHWRRNNPTLENSSLLLYTRINKLNSKFQFIYKVQIAKYISMWQIMKHPPSLKQQRTEPYHLTSAEISKSIYIYTQANWQYAIVTRKWQQKLHRMQVLSRERATHKNVHLI
jgi:hypothetical protein